MPGDTKKPRELSVLDHIKGVLSGDRTILARTITLVESSSSDHREKAGKVLGELSQHAGGAMRVGVTGAPGVGKSTLIEALGCHLVDRGRRVAVLAVDPSSIITKGSILGDKTRMERLSRKESCFIRPSPSGGTLGGVARMTKETVTVCEAAGYDVILIETVGVGQSEVSVRRMVDFFLLVTIAGAGDELQGIKRGVTELADALVINKADGDNKRHAEAARVDYERASHYLMPATEGWQTRVLTCSSVTGEGIDRIWELIQEFKEATEASGFFEARRRQQDLQWIHAMVEDHLKSRFLDHPRIKRFLPKIEEAVAKGELTASAALDELLEKFEK